MSVSVCKLFHCWGKYSRREGGLRLVCSAASQNVIPLRNKTITSVHNNGNCHGDSPLQQRRWVSTINTSTAVPFPAPPTGAIDSEREKFVAIFPDIIKDLTDVWTTDSELSEIMKWFAKVVDYNVTGGKMTRGLAVVYSYRTLAPDAAEHIRLAQILGWCVEMLQGFFIVLDDIMDRSATRRGRTCWYLRDDTGLAAINDGILLEAGVYHLLQKHFQHKSYYVKLLHLFHDVTFKTTMGQSLDLLTSQEGKKPDYSKFTVERYSAIVKYKTAYYSFYLPVALAMHMAGVEDREALRQAEALLLDVGHFFQVQDDYLDCFGDPEVTGKAGTDISTGKCSWPAVTALRLASPRQRATFEDCYASDDVKRVRAIEDLYHQLCIQSVYADYEEQTYNEINRSIQKLPHTLPRHLFINFLKKIYKRGS